MLSSFFTLFQIKKNRVGLSKEQCGYSDVAIPDRFKIRKRPDEDFVFSFDDRLAGYPTAFAEAYADQNFCAFIQKTVVGTPSLIFRKQVHPQRILQTARLKGVVVRIPKGRMEFLDMIFQNKVNSYRKQTRVLLPFQKENGVMLNVPAWIYQDNPEAWKDKFDFDFEMWRGRPDGYFQPAVLDYNPRFPHIEKFYVHPWLKRTEGLEEERANAVRRTQQNNKPASTVS
jgi:gamma-glutamylcyclotransferase (GGCT)/AIG2-like uncharacterized protein YtfP